MTVHTAGLHAAETCMLGVNPHRAGKSNSGNIEMLSSLGWNNILKLGTLVVFGPVQFWNYLVFKYFFLKLCKFPEDIHHLRNLLVCRKRNQTRELLKRATYKFIFYGTKVAYLLLCQFWVHVNCLGFRGDGSSRWPFLWIFFCNYLVDQYKHLWNHRPSFVWAPNNLVAVKP